MTGLASSPRAPGGPSLAVRAVLAVGLTIGFYALAIGLAALLLGIAVLQLVNRQIDRLTLYTLAGGAAIAVSILPRRDRFAAPGPQIDLSSNPRLAAELQMVAARVRQPMPEEIYVTLDMNAGVAERAGRFGVARVRYLVLGLPLMRLMSVSEFRAVLAHEFGHFDAGDTAIGPWVYRTRRSIIRAARYAGAVSWLLYLPFRAYAWLFLRVTGAISRQQEFAADALAARVAGSEPMRAALRKLDYGAPALATYVRGWVAPAVTAGFVPPLTDGFSDYLRRAGQPAVDGEAPTPPRPNPNDSHPPTPARLAALAALPPGPGPDVADEPAASSLLSNLPPLEWSALAMRLAPSVTLTPLTWDRVGGEVFVPAWRRTVETHRGALAGAWLSNLVDWVLAATALGQMLARDGKRPLPDAAARATGLALLSRAVAVALVAQGWTMSAMPAEAVTCRRGAAAISPYGIIERMAAGSLDRATWATMREELGIADAPLAAPG